jgi:hypothetical protein
MAAGTVDPDKRHQWSLRAGAPGNLGAAGCHDCSQLPAPVTNATLPAKLPVWFVSAIVCSSPPPAKRPFRPQIENLGRPSHRPHHPPRVRTATSTRLLGSALRNYKVRAGRPPPYVDAWLERLTPTPPIRLGRAVAVGRRTVPAAASRCSIPWPTLPHPPT